jgi:hypothetical protein
MSLLETVIPENANNDFRGGAVPLYTFCVLIAITTFRSTVHFLKEDSGVNSIASIHLFPGDPDPNQVIYMFSSLWGSQQVIMVMVYVIVLFRFRNLIPLMFALMVVEVGLRFIVGSIHPLTEEFYVRTPPGKWGNLPMLVVSMLMVHLSHLKISRTVEPTLEPTSI